LWRQAAPLIFQNQDISPIDITAKSSSDGKIYVKTSCATQFRQIQKALLANKIDFHTFSLAAERQLKVVVKGVPTDITTVELENELTARGFEVQLVKRFGPVDKPMPICLIILSGTQAKNIFEMSELFYLKISVETYKKSGPSQCHSCQKFGHGSKNCGNSPRCVKCAGSHSTSECTKPRDQAATCANCNGAHTANFRGCPSFSEIAKNFTTKPPTPKHPSSSKSTYLPTLPQNNASQTPPGNLSTHHLDYANATKNKPAIKTDKVINLLTELLSAISTSEDPKTIISVTINSFLSLLKNSYE